VSQVAIPPSLLFERLEARLAPLERLPRGLWLWSCVHSHGSVGPRLGGIEALRDANTMIAVFRLAHVLDQWPYPRAT